MATSLSELRKSRSSMLDKIVKDLDSGGKRNNEDDSRFWKLNRDKAGNGSAIIRFLPPVNGDELPWVKEFTFGFTSQTSGKWYINASPSAIGLPDPVVELNAADWASKDETRIEQAKQRRRRTQYISNILVIKDPANPENEGKVFLWKFGKKLMEMVMSKAKPEFDDTDPVFVWDIDSGCNLRLRIKTVAGYPNYDSSEWASISPLASSDEEIERILENTHRLSEFTDPSRFKSYDALKKELDRVLAHTSTAHSTAEAKARKELDEDLAFDIDAEIKKAVTTQPRKVEKKVAVVEDDEDDLESFKKMLDTL